MGNLLSAAFIFLGMLIYYQIWVSVSICRADEYDNRQRILQCIFIWMIPFLGALACQLVLRCSRAPIKPANISFVDQSPNGDMPQHSGATD